MATSVEPRLAFRSALRRYKGSRLAAIRLAQGAPPDGARIRPVGNADEITEHLDQPAAVEALVARLETGSRLALSLFALTETTSISLAGLAHTLGILGSRARSRAIVQTARAGLAGDRADARARSGRRLSRRCLCAASPAPAAAAGPTRRSPTAVRTVRPDSRPPRSPARSAGPRVRRAGADPPAGCALAAGRSRAVAPDPSGHALQARSRPAHGRPGSGCRRSPMRSKPLCASAGALARAGVPRRSDRTRPVGRAAPRRLARILDRKRGPLAPDDRHRVVGLTDLARAGINVRRTRTRSLPALPYLRVGACCSGCRRSMRIEWAASTIWRASLRQRWPAVGPVVVCRGAGRRPGRPAPRPSQRRAGPAVATGARTAHRAA